MDSMRDRVVHGDCADVMMHGMPAESVDLTVTSPPYDDLRDYHGYTFDFPAIARGLRRVTKPGGVVVWVVGDRTVRGNRSLTSFRQAMGFQAAGFHVHDVMIFKKKSNPFPRSNAYTPCWDFMFVLSRGPPKTFRPLMKRTKYRGPRRAAVTKRPDGTDRRVPRTFPRTKVRPNVWEYAVGLHGTTSDRYAFAHPAMFPEQLAEDHVLSWTDRGDMVFDPMCGAGTTLKMAKMHGRRFFGVDVSAEYVRLARRRVAQLL